MPLTQSEIGEIAHQVADQVVSRVKGEIPNLALQAMKKREGLPPVSERNPGNPEYGPILGERATPAQKAFWEEAQREAKEKYPIYGPQSLAEAKRAGVTPEEMHLIVAHEMYLEKMRQLGERYLEEEWAKRPPSERREEEEEADARQG